MNYKLTILILVAMIAAVLVPVSAENVYVDHNPALYDVLPVHAYGYVVFYIRAGGSAQDLNVWIKNDAVNATFDPYYNPDKSVIEGQNPHFKKIAVLANGESKPELLASGCWTAYIQKGNGDQMEEQHFIIGGGATEGVQFLGSAVSSVDTKVCHPVYKITDAKYGSGGCYEVIIIDVPAWDETVEHPAETHVVYHEEVNRTVHHDAVTHQEFIVDGHYRVTHHEWKWESGHFVEKVKCTNPAHEGWHVQTAACTEVYGHYVTVVDTPAWDEVVVDTPAWSEIVTDKEPWIEIIHHPAVTHKEQMCNEMIDVTSAVQSVVNGGNTMFLFDNAQNPGGIFGPDGTTLLYGLTDPAPGFVKSVSILYTDGCGSDRIIQASEYDLIDLVAGGVSIPA
jgi:hypothetical protein